MSRGTQTTKNMFLFLLLTSDTRPTWAHTENLERLACMNISWSFYISVDSTSYDNNAWNACFNLEPATVPASSCPQVSCNHGVHEITILQFQSRPAQFVFYKIAGMKDRSSRLFCVFRVPHEIHTWWYACRYACWQVKLLTAAQLWNLSQILEREMVSNFTLKPLAVWSLLSVQWGICWISGIVRPVGSFY